MKHITISGTWLGIQKMLAVITMMKMDVFANRDSKEMKKHWAMNELSLSDDWKNIKNGDKDTGFAL